MICVHFLFKGWAVLNMMSLDLSVGTKSPLITRYRELACRTGLGQDTYPKFFSGSVSGAKIVDGPKTMSYLMSLDGTLQKKTAWRKLPILFFVLLSQIRLIKPPNQKNPIRVALVSFVPFGNADFSNEHSHGATP